MTTLRRSRSFAEAVGARYRCAALASPFRRERHSGTAASAQGPPARQPHLQRPSDVRKAITRTVERVLHELLTAIDAGDWARVRLLLHPYARWTDKQGTALRGRSAVIAHLLEAPVTTAPCAYELRDGQICRWHEGA